MHAYNGYRCRIANFKYTMYIVQRGVDHLKFVNVVKQSIVATVVFTKRLSSNLVLN